MHRWNYIFNLAVKNSVSYQKLCLVHMKRSKMKILECFIFYLHNYLVPSFLVFFIFAFYVSFYFFLIFLLPPHLQLRTPNFSPLHRVFVLVFDWVWLLSPDNQFYIVPLRTMKYLYLCNWLIRKDWRILGPLALTAAGLLLKKSKTFTFLEISCMFSSLFNNVLFFLFGLTCDRNLRIWICDIISYILIITPWYQVIKSCGSAGMFFVIIY